MTYYHLGSWTTITDAEGNVEQELSFDAWGNFRNPYTWTGANTTRPMFDRGFTGHEHLFEFGLINMNGRMYDPVMSTFLSVDNYVQSPENSQNFNRYAYCLNNPLRYTDPDGEWVQYVVGGLLGAFNGYSIGKAAGLTGWDLAWSTVGGAAVGVLSGCAGSGVSAALNASNNCTAWGAILGSASGGAVSGFGNGLLSGSLIGTGEKSMGDYLFSSTCIGMASGAIGGATGGAVGGGWGAFAGGAIAGASSYAMNYDYSNFNSSQYFKEMALSAGLGGSIGLASYHCSLAMSYKQAGVSKSGLTYNQYAKIIRITQQSFFFQKEPLAIPNSEGGFNAIELCSEDMTRPQNLADYKDAKLGYHAHHKFGNEGFSDVSRVVANSQVTGKNYDFNQNDVAVRQMLTQGAKAGEIWPTTMFVGSREGHVFYWTNWGAPVCYDYNFSNVFAPYNASWSNPIQIRIKP